MLFRFFSPDNPLNNSNVNDPEINRMLDAQRKEFDVEKRKQIIWDIQRRNAEMMYYIPGVKGYSYTAVSSSVKNYMPTVTYGFADTIMQLWLAA
jgi:ABC-type transport system substrate-binding protein